MRRFLFLPILLFIFLFFHSWQAQAQVVAIGDSNIAGKGVASSDNYPSKLERALRDKGYRGSVINAGINGDTTQGVLARLDADVPAGTKVAIIWVGVNDVKKHGATEASVIANKKLIADRLRARGIKVVMLGGKYYPAGNPALLQNDRDRHINAAGFDYVVARTLSQVEAALGMKR